MKRSLTHGSPCALGVLCALLTFSCGGEQFRHMQQGEQIVLPTGETHEGWYFAGGDRVLIQGTVNGDAYVAGGEVRVEGTINGDLLVAGGQVTISGRVTDDVRAAGGMVALEGTVGKNVTVAGGAVRVSKAAEIGGGLLAAGGSLDLSGSVDKEVRAASGEMTLTGKVQGNLSFTGDRLSVIQGASVGGNLHAHVEEKDRVKIADGVVSGTTEITLQEVKPESRILGRGPWQFWVKIFWALSLVVTALVYVLLFPKHLAGIATTILQRPGMSALWGILGIILIPVAILILLVTVVGLPLGLLVLVLFLWILYLSQLTLGVALGERFFLKEPKTPGRRFWAYALGIIIMQALTFVPFVCLLITLAGVVFGVGALLLVVWDELRLRRA